MHKQRDAVVLHLTDLHFGWDGSTSDRDARKLALGRIKDTILKLEVDWRPTIICISGDVGWRGIASDYEDAAVWLTDLLSTLKLTPNELIICPGNHDVDREHVIGMRPKNSIEADRVLALPLKTHVKAPFQAFTEFCRSFGIPSLHIGDIPSYLVGTRVIQEINFVAYNSSWFCLGDDDKGNLWIGLPQIRHMEAHGQIQEQHLSAENVTIALMHHPKEWLAEPEVRADEVPPRPNTIDYLAKRCDLLLSGHNHGEVRSADMLAETTWHFNGGATYGGVSHFNNFRLIKMLPDSVTYRSFEFDPRYTEWQQRGEVIKLGNKKKEVDHKQDNVVAYSRLRELALIHARRLLEVKSRAVKPYGKLPDFVNLSVDLHVRGQKVGFNSKQEIQLEANRIVETSLAQAVTQDRRILLLGDLGTGKSTLAGMFVEQSLRQNQENLAFLFPAKSLVVSAFITLNGLLTSLSNYINDEIATFEPDIVLANLIQAQAEVILVIDGLDELPLQQAAKLLKILGTLPTYAANVRVIVTGRPIELAGVVYEEWQIFTTRALNDKAWFQMFRNEALAEGNSPDEANRAAENLSKRLLQDPNLGGLASTPFATRLLYKRLLGSDDKKPHTLGDLLFELLSERLGEWARRDDKAELTESFERHIPDAVGRAKVLGKLALHHARSGPLTKQGALELLETIVSANSSTDARALANEALNFFNHSGLHCT